MKLTFKEKNNGLKNEIYYDDLLIGEVALNIWNQKWKLDPHFTFSNMKFESFYKAGKALANLYSDTFMLFCENHPDDTDETDMRGVF